MEKRNRRKKLKEIDPEEYEDEIWLAYVEPQYENEYSRMLAAQNRPALGPGTYLGHAKAVTTKEELES